MKEKPAEPEPFSRPLRQLNTLHTILQIISRSSGQKQMLNELLDVLREQMGMRRGVFMLSTPDGRELVVEAASQEETHSQAHAVRYQRGEGITGRVLATGQPAIIPRIADEPEFQGRIHLRQDKHDREYSFICVPITLNNEIIGTFAVDAPAGNMEYLNETQRFLQGIS